MKNYVTPVLCVNAFDAKDVITASNLLLGIFSDDDIKKNNSVSMEDLY